MVGFAMLVLPVVGLFVYGFATAIYRRDWPLVAEFLIALWLLVAVVLVFSGEGGPT
jgi:hypothetical protein